MMQMTRVCAIPMSDPVPPARQHRTDLCAASLHMAMAAPTCHILEVSQGYMPMLWELLHEPFDIRPDGTVHAPPRVRARAARSPARRPPPGTGTRPT